MESVDGFRTAVTLCRVRIAQEADQQIAQLLSLGQRLEPSTLRLFDDHEPSTASADTWLRVH